MGDGDTVTDQTPAGGAIVPGNASIILYLGQEKPDTPCTVPNVVGKSASEANKAITNAGLIMKVTGTTTASSGNVYAITPVSYTHLGTSLWRMPNGTWTG